MTSLVILFALLIVATATDLVKHKIYNWTTYWGIVVAMSLAATSTFTDEGVFSTVGLRQSLFGLVLCGGIMLACFVCFQIGGGDVKLIAMIGAFLGPEFGVQVLLWTFVLGALSAIVILALKLGVINLATRVIQQTLSKLGLGHWQTLSTEEKKQLQLNLYLGPCALAAMTIVLLGLNGYPLTF